MKLDATLERVRAANPAAPVAVDGDALFDTIVALPGDPRLGRRRRAPLGMTRLVLVAVVCFLVLTGAATATYLIVRGSGPAGESISRLKCGGPSQVSCGSARFLAGGPEGLAFDGHGNLYSADCEDGFVFRVSRRGQFSVVAGTGVQGFSGNGGPALKATFACPAGVALDAHGNLYVADASNNRVRRISPGGVVRALAGAGPIPPVASMRGAYGGNGGPAARARFKFPVGVAFDAHGNLYVADRDNGAVRMISPAGRITTVAGTGVRGYSGDGGPAAKARLNQPEGFAFDRAGNLYVSDSANNRVRRIDARTGVVTTVAGNGRHGYTGDGGPATKARLSDPYGLAFDAQGNLFVSEPDEGVVRRINSRGVITTFAGTGRLGFSGDGGPATKAKLNQPYGLAFDSAGNLYIADNGNGRIRKINKRGVITTFYNGHKPS
jgi:DNA-binding beta-propeller fold protein YncE